MKKSCCENKLWKKALSLFLAVIMGFGSFVSLSFSSIPLSDWIDVRQVFASSNNSVPLFYRYGELVGLYKVDYTNQTPIQYRIGESGEWTTYDAPFSVPAFETTKVYARIGTNGTPIYKNISTTDDAIGVYYESNVDFELSYNGINFGYERIYDSVSKNWFESIHSKILATNSRLEVTLPDNTKIPMIRQDANTYVDQLTGKTVTKSDSEYVYNDDYYKYHFAINNLQSVTYLSAIEDNNSNILNLNRTVNTEEISISDATGRGFYISDYYSVPAPEDSGVNYYSVKEITDPNNNKITYTTKAGRYISVVDQAGVTLGSYNYTNNATDYQMIKSNDKSIEYYSNGRLKKITYDNGSWVEYRYIDSDKLYTTVTSSGETTQTVYNDAFLPVSHTDEYGNQTTYTYDNHYRILSETTADSTTTYTYDNNGRLISWVTGNDEDDCYYTYDNIGNVIREQYGENYTYYTYDSHRNNIVYATLKEDYNGEAPATYDSSLTCFDATTYTYDSHGRITEEVYSSGDSISYTYDNRGNITQETTVTITDGTPVTTTTGYTYDELGNLLTTSSGDESSSYIYDPAGRTLLSNENGECTRTIYDSLGRVVQEISPEDYDSTKEGLPDENTYADANVGQRYVYNEETGNIDSETNRLDVVTTYEYYPTGEKKSEAFDLYEYKYDVKGNLTKIFVDDVNTISYNYNTDYQLTSEVYANGQSLRYTYDNNGNLSAQYHDDDSSPFVTYTYDSDNKLTEKTNTDTGLRYVYDGDNVTVSRVSDNTVIQSYTETNVEADELNNIEAETDITESHFGNTFSTVYKNGSATFTSGNNVTSYEYNENDDFDIATSTIKYNNNDVISTSYEYDSRRNITRENISNFSVSNAFEYECSYTYDNKDRISSTTIGIGTRAFTYDDKGQLTCSHYSEQRSDNSTYNQYYNYTYDDRGNILLYRHNDYTLYDNGSYSMGEGLVTYRYHYDGWTDVLEDINGDPFTYDENGNITHYRWRDFNWTSGRYLESIDCGEDYYSYTYDENGIRTSKTVNGRTIYFNYQDGVLRSQSCGNDVTYFQYDENNSPIGYVHNGVQCYYIKNQLGDIINITNDDGEILSNYTYDDIGQIQEFDIYDSPEYGFSQGEIEAAYANPFYYRGYYLDVETEFYYLQSRYYDPEFDRFLNADLPEYAKFQKNEPIGTNLFAYCCNDPINNTDATGYWGKSTHYGIAYDVAYNYFSERISEKIGNYCKALDDVYPSSAYAENAMVHVEERQWQYYHFNGYKYNPSEKKHKDTRLDYAESWLNKAINCAKSRKTEDAWKYLGYSLHCLQDIDAHGQIGAGKEIPAHVPLIIDKKTGYEWKDNTFTKLKLVTGSKKRYRSSKQRTSIQINKFINSTKNCWGKDRNGKITA